ncbi:MAG TPA: 3-hydroxybutyryl-CoA dehydrogenase [Alphaproteobacteria bacterium]|nr:3-hydroxybutyryl-CoA dehydrogenase [Alphaproteobacteria bacterium]
MTLKTETNAKQPNPTTADLKGTVNAIQQIGVIGAGQMGSGIAHVFALSGYQVQIFDNNPQQLEKALDQIGQNMNRQVKKGLITEGARQQGLKKISPISQLSAFQKSDLVVEAAVENEAIKRQIFQQLCPHLPKHALLATNTSSISITRLASATDRPAQFIGMHFMNPVPVMQLIEVIRGLATSAATEQTIREIAQKLGKVTARSEDSPGFLVNRILMPMINEAIYALYEGVGDIESIDVAMKLGTNHPMGPLELADFIGLDTCLAIMQVLYDGLSDSKYRPCPLLVKYVDAGWLGRKSKRGFYDYSGEKPVPTR